MGMFSSSSSPSGGNELLGSCESEFIAQFELMCAETSSGAFEIVYKHLRPQMCF